MTRLANRRFLIPIALFLLAYGVRLVYLAQIRSSPHFDSPIMDAAYHDEWARGGHPGSWAEGEVFFRAPLYPYFLRTLYGLFGPSYLAVRLVQFAVGALTCVLLYFLGLRVAGLSVGMLAGLMAAFYGPLIYFEGELLLPVLEAFLATALLLCLAWALTVSERSRSEVPRPAWLLVGLCIGLFAVTRPNVLAFVPVLLGYLIVRLGWRLGARCGLICLVGPALCILPVTARNYVVGRDFVLISSQAGVNFYIGNNPGSDGTTAVVPGTRATWWGGYRDTINLAEQQSGRSLRPSEVSAFWSARAFEFIGARPLDWLRLTVRKLALFWNGFELPNNTQIYGASRFSSLIGVLIGKWGPVHMPFGIIAPLGLVGLGLAVAQRRQAFTPVMLFLITYSLTVIAFFVCSRFRVPCIPPLLLLASFVVVEVARLVRKRNWRVPAAVVAALVLGTVLLNSDFYGTGSISPAKTHVDAAQAHLNRGRFQQAEQEARQALRLEPQRPEHKLAVATCLLARGRPQEAAVLFSEVLAASPGQCDALLGMGDALAQQGRLEEAASHYQQAVALDPRDAKAARGLADCLTGLGRGAEALQLLAEGGPGDAAPEALQLAMARSHLDRGEFTRAAEICEGLLARGQASAEAYVVLGNAYISLGRLDRVRPLAEAALREAPDHAGGLLLLGISLWKQGDFDPAIRAFRRALAAAPSRVEIWSNLAACYAEKGDYDSALEASARALELDAANPQARFVRAACLYCLGQPEEAAEQCRLLLEQHPDYLPARELLDQCGG